MYEKSSVLLAGTGVRKISFLACGFSPVKIQFSEYPERLMKFMYFSIKCRYIAIFY